MKCDVGFSNKRLASCSQHKAAEATCVNLNMQLYFRLKPNGLHKTRLNAGCSMS